MKGRRFENFSQRVNQPLAEAPPATDPEENPQTPEEPETPTDPDRSEEDESMSTDTPVEQTEAYQAGFKAANDRVNAVFAHENAAGREAHAVRLLGRASLSAEEISAELAHFPKAEQLSAAAQREAAEEAGRKEMRDEMDKAGNADLGASRDENASSARARSSARWDKANARLSGQKKEG